MLKLADTAKKVASAVKNAYDSTKSNSNKSSSTVQTNTEKTNSANDGNWIGTGTSKANRSSGTSSRTSSSIGTSTDYGTYQDDLERLSRAQQKTQIAQLKQARDKALANLDVQEQEIKPTYQTARNQASATSQSGARSFAEYLANRGLTNSGASAQGEINRLSSLQNSLGNIDTAEANAHRDIANQKTAVENDYVAGVANANNAIAQEYYNNLLNYNQQQREMVNQLQQQALGQYSNDYQAQINNLLAQGYSPNSLEVLQLQALRGNKMGTNYSNANTPENALASIQAGNINYNNASALGWTVAQAQQYYNNLLAQAQAEAQAEADQQAFENYIKQQQLANDTAQTNYNINKPYSSKSSTGTTSSAQNGEISLKDTLSILENAETLEQAKNMVDTLYNNYQISDATLQAIYAMNGWSL